MFTEWSSEKFMLFCWSEVQKVTRGPMVSAVFNLLWNHRTSWNKLGMFTEWSLEKFFFVDQRYKKLQEAQWCQKGCCLFWMFFSETTGPVGIKLGLNVHLMVLYKVYVFFVDQKCRKETRGPKCVERVSSVLNLLLWNHWAN